MVKNSNNPKKRCKQAIPTEQTKENTHTNGSTGEKS
jgi:hypothetical protein